MFRISWRDGSSVLRFWVAKWCFRGPDTLLPGHYQEPLRGDEVDGGVAGVEPVQLLPYRYRGSSHRAGQALSSGRDRPHSKFALVELHEKATQRVRPPSSTRCAKPCPTRFHRAHRQRNSLHNARQSLFGCRQDQACSPERRDLPRSCLRVRLRQSRYRPPPHHAQTSPDQRTTTLQTRSTHLTPGLNIQGHSSTISVCRYQGWGPPLSKKPPVGPSSGSRASKTVSAAPCSIVWVPLLPFRSVAV